MAKVKKREWKSKDAEGKPVTKTSWVADYVDLAGKRRLKTLPTKKAAEAYLHNIRGELTSGIHVAERDSITVGEAGDAWLAQAKADGLERSTLQQYRSHLELHIKPFLGGVSIARLTPPMIQTFRNQLASNGRSSTMLKRVLSSLSSILSDAILNGKAARNVVRERRRTRRQRRQERRRKRRLQVGVDIPTKDEIRAMLSGAAGRFRPMLVTAIFTGLRASELRGLRWTDVNLDGAEVTVRQRADRWGVIDVTKSEAGQRSVPLAPLVVNTLREWRLVCPKGPLDLVFPNTIGKPERLDTFHYQFLAPLQHAVGISSDPRRPKYSIHKFRHAAASLFIEQGFSPKRIQEIMGHATISMTFDQYGHLWPAPEDDKVAMRQLQAKLVG